MTPRRSQSDVWVSDDEQDNRWAETQQKDKKILKPYGGGRNLSQQWRRILQRLTRVGVRGNTRPNIGQNCLIMTGKPGEEHGQMGVITSQTPAMVSVTYRRNATDSVVTRLKQPRSLILLEAGLTVAQDSNGSVWIRQQPDCNNRTF
jgi:hypothetical protein